MCQFQAVYTTFLKSLGIVAIVVHASLSVATMFIGPILPVILYTVHYHVRKGKATPLQHS